MGAFQRPVRSHTFPQTHPYVYRPSIKWGGLIHRWTIRVRILCWKGLQPPIPTAQASVFLLRDCVLPGSCIPQPLTRRRGRCNSASRCFAWWYHRFHWNLGLTALQPVVREHSQRGMCGEANLFTSWSLENERGKKRCQVLVSFKCTPPVTSLPPMKPHSLEFHHLQITSHSRTEFQYVSLCGTF